MKRAVREQGLLRAARTALKTHACKAVKECGSAARRGEVARLMRPCVPHDTAVGERNLDVGGELSFSRAAGVLSVGA